MVNLKLLVCFVWLILVNYYEIGYVIGEEHHSSVTAFVSLDRNEQKFLRVSELETKGLLEEDDEEKDAVFAASTTKPSTSTSKKPKPTTTKSTTENRRKTTSQPTTKLTTKVTSKSTSKATSKATSKPTIQSTSKATTKKITNSTKITTKQQTSLNSTPKASTQSAKTSTSTLTTSTTIPDRDECIWDWTVNATGIVQPVRQSNSNCSGVSSAFAISAFFEGYCALFLKKSIEFSVQQFIDCYMIKPECTGVFSESNELILESEKDYPYGGDGKPQKCKNNGNPAQILEPNYFISQNTSEWGHLLRNQGPLYVSITSRLDNYSGEILTPETCPQGLEKTEYFLLVGHWRRNGVEYWRVKSSRGKSWGVDGFALIEKANSTCGLTEVTYVMNYR